MRSPTFLQLLTILLLVYASNSKRPDDTIDDFENHITEPYLNQDQNFYDDANLKLIAPTALQNEPTASSNKEDANIKITPTTALQKEPTASGNKTENATEETCVGDKEFCNMTEEEYVTMLNEYIYPQPYEWVLITTHCLVFTMGLIGNALVCIAVYRNHTMRTVTNYFIVNLAVADFMVIAFCLPPTVLWDVTETWFLGDCLCKVLLYFQVSFFNIFRFDYNLNI